MGARGGCWRALARRSSRRRVPHTTHSSPAPPGTSAGLFFFFFWCRVIFARPPARVVSVVGWALASAAFARALAAPLARGRKAPKVMSGRACHKPYCSNAPQIPRRAARARPGAGGIPPQPTTPRAKVRNCEGMPGMGCLRARVWSVGAALEYDSIDFPGSFGGLARARAAPRRERARAEIGPKIGEGGWAGRERRKGGGEKKEGRPSSFGAVVVRSAP